MYRFRIDGPDIPFLTGLVVLLLAVPVHECWPLPLPVSADAFHDAVFSRDMATAFILFIGFLYLCFASTYRLIQIYRDGYRDLHNPVSIGKSGLEIFAPLIVVVALLLYFRHVLL